MPLTLLTFTPVVPFLHSLCTSVVSSGNGDDLSGGCSRLDTFDQAFFPDTKRLGKLITAIATLTSFNSQLALQAYTGRLENACQQERPHLDVVLPIAKPSA